MKTSVPHLVVVIDELLQNLMIGIFSISIGIWHKSLGKIINSTLQKE
jgi:hypothetical protein